MHTSQVIITATNSLEAFSVLLLNSYSTKSISWTFDYVIFIILLALQFPPLLLSCHNLQYKNNHEVSDQYS